MSTSKPSSISKFSVVDAPVVPAPIAAQDIVAGSPQASVALLWRNAEGTLFNGVWHCTPGAFYLDHADETVTFIEGRATVTAEGGKPVELAAGDTGYFPAGTRVLWEVHETVRKAFHNHDAERRLLAAV
jgi:uncharacterized cupin superfamily protein